MSGWTIVGFPVYMIMRNKLRTRNGGVGILHRDSRAWGDHDFISLFPGVGWFTLTR